MAKCSSSRTGAGRPVRRGIFFGHPVDHFLHAPAGDCGQFRFPPGNLMDKVQGRFFIAPVQLKPSRIFCGQIAPLKAFHEKSHDDGHGDGVDAVVVAVPVGFHDEFGVPDSQIGTEGGGGFVLRAVDPDPLPVPAGGQGYGTALGAAQVAARETAVHALMNEQLLRIGSAADLTGPGIRPQLVIVDRQGLKGLLVHETDQAGRSLAVHLQRLGIDLLHHLVEPGPGLFDPVPVLGAIGIFSLGIIGQDDHGPDIFIAHDRTQTGPAGLLGPEDPPGPIDRLGGIIVMAVDTAVGRPGGADAGGQKDDILFAITPA